MRESERVIVKLRVFAVLWKRERERARAREREREREHKAHVAGRLDTSSDGSQCLSGCIITTFVATKITEYSVIFWVIFN